MSNKFEHAKTATPSEAAERRRLLVRELEKSDTVYVTCGADRWACKFEGLLINVISRCDKGTFVVDVPTGVKVSEGAEVTTFAYVNFLQTFKYKTGEFTAVDESGDESWDQGSEIHMRFEHVIHKQEVGDIVRIAANTVDDCKETLAGVASGRIGLEEGITGKDSMRGLERLLERIGS